MSSRYRPIIPAKPRPGEPASENQGRLLTKRKRIGVHVACNNCRARKASCNGDRPSCPTCVKRNLECAYDTKYAGETRHTALARELAALETELQQHRDIVERLRAAPEAEAFAIVRRLRSTPNIGTVLDSIKSSTSSRNPSEVEVARATMAPGTSNSEFELFVLHKKAYMLIPDIDMSAIDVASIFAPCTERELPYVSTKALVENYNKLQTKDFSGEEVPKLNPGPPSPLQGTSHRVQSPVLGPFPNRVYCDARLSRVSFRYWTNVPVSNEYAASLLSAYFENEHAIIGTFDISTFLDDLVDCRQDFCSSFLVSSVLGLASLCFSSLDSRALPLGAAFLAEAETLWSAERSTDSVTNLSATLTLAISTMMNGHDEISLEAFAESRYMAERMSLLGVRQSMKLSQIFSGMPNNQLRAYAQAAWGLLLLDKPFHSCRVFFYDLEPVAFPPAIPISSLAINDHSAKEDTPSQFYYLGDTFAKWSEMWVISQEIQALCYKADGSRTKKSIPLAAAESKFVKLLTWVGSLGDGMTSENQGLPHVSVLHAYFHIIILDLFRPFLDSTEPLQLRSFSSPDMSPQEVFDASLRQLQRLLLDYSSRYDPRFYNFMLNGAVLQVLHTTLQRKGVLGPHMNLSFSLGWIKEIYKRFAVIGEVAQAYMAMGMEFGMISSAEARHFMGELQQNGHCHDLTKIGSACIVDFATALSSANSSRAQDIAKRFDELAMFDEVIRTDLIM